MKNSKADISAVFYTDDERHLPAQIFANTRFSFLITLGGGFVDSESEYVKLTDTLSNIGETCMCFQEDIVGQNATEKLFKTELKISEDFSAFKRLEATFDPHFGLVLSNFYIYGENPNWGIYLCEYPAIKLIGCIDEYLPLFQDTLTIRGTGLKEVEPLLKQEFGSNMDFKNLLIRNYHL